MEPEPNDNGDLVHNKRECSDAFAKGLSTMLTAVIKDFDSTAEDTLKTQYQLSSSLDRLTRELDQLLEDAPLSFIMQHAAKISVVRRRVSSLNSVLKSIQQRIDIIDRLLTMGVLQDQSKKERFHFDYEEQLKE